MSTERILARRAVRRAVASGVLTKPSTCSKCDLSVESKDLDGHHHNGYDEPYVLDVVWLCKRCHGLVHGRAFTITNDERRAGVRIRQQRQTLEQRQRQVEWGRQLGRQHGRLAMTQLNERRTPLERQLSARAAAARSTSNDYVTCENCGNEVTKAWFSRHRVSNCRKGSRSKSDDQR